MQEMVSGWVKRGPLEALLIQSWPSETLGTIPGQISCFSKNNQLIVFFHYLARVSSPTETIVTHLNSILEAETSWQASQIQIYCIFHQQSYPLDEPLVEEIFRTEPIKLKSKFKPKLKFFKNSPLAAGIGFSLIILFLYALTRPCIVGSCPEIKQAQDLAQEALTSVETGISTAAVFSARKQLEKSLKILNTVPWWSADHSEATILKKDFQAKFQDLDIIVRANETGDKGINLINKAPISVAQWQEAKTLLNNAIATLNQVSLASNLASLTTVKIQQYRINLAYIDQSIASEKKASENLRLAKEAANLAKIYQNNAQSLTDWQAVYRNWQAAIQRLEAILPGTTVYPESRQLRNLYLPQFVKAETRKKQEEFADNIYQRATQEAKLAKQAELKNQWTEAVTHWRSALQYIKQVPKSSFQSSEKEPAIATYILSLRVAEAKQKAGIERQKLISELDKICLGKIKICQYQMRDKNATIKITLISSYLQQLWNTALQAKAQGNLQGQIDLLNHISKLEQSLQTISKNTGRRIEVYNSEGGLITIYKAGENP